MRPAELEELLQKLESHRQKLVSQVQELSEEEANRRPAEGEWSAKEQLYFPPSERRASPYGSG